MKKPYQSPIMQAATITMIILQTKYRIGTCTRTEYKHYRDRRKNGQKNFVGFGARTRDLALHFVNTIICLLLPSYAVVTVDAETLYNVMTWR